MKSVVLDIDSGEIIRKLTFSNKLKLDENIKLEIEKSCLNKSLDECLRLESKGILLKDKLLNFIRMEIYSYRSNYFHLKLENKDFLDPLLCRCMGKHLSDIKSLYHEHKGDQKKILMESHIGGVCGTCLGDFKDIYNKEEENKAYIEGLPAKVWVSKVEKLIEEFYFVCPAEYSSMKFDVISMNSFHLKIRCNKGDSKLKRLEILDTLSNYFQSELKLDLKLSVVI